MPPTAVVLALGAAVLHATWNLLAAREKDIHAATAIAMLVSVLTWAVEPAAVPWVVASSALELTYFVLLATAYTRFEMSVVYPIARGSAPVLVLLGGIVFTGAGASGAQAAGVALVAAGVVLVRGLGRTALPDLLAGLAIAATIATYTMVDREGIRHADAVSYYALIVALPAVFYLGWVGRNGTARLRSTAHAPVIWAGIAMLATYLLVLTALRIAPAASVAAVRETSVVVAAFLARAFLDEAVGPRRMVGAAVVAAGIAAVAVG
jgi:drug/metabolite transporter (DMT)-like permease